MNKILYSPTVRYYGGINSRGTYLRKTRHALDIHLYASSHQFSDLDEFEDELMLYSPFKCIGINFNRAFMLRPGEVLRDDLRFNRLW